MRHWGRFAYIGLLHLICRGLTTAFDHDQVLQSYRVILVVFLGGFFTKN